MHAAITKLAVDWLSVIPFAVQSLVSRSVLTGTAFETASDVLPLIWCYS